VEGSVGDDRDGGAEVALDVVAVRLEPVGHRAGRAAFDRVVEVTELGVEVVDCGRLWGRVL
jgi:hypothetical protein